MEGKPLKAKNLKIIDHLGTLYATFNGSSMWKLDKVAFGILRLCDGKRSVEDIVNEVAKIISHKPEDVKPVIEEILNELTKMKFIEWV
ncbi:MAG: PqqD family peptide modification chaperone [Candidatus Aenigmarchaeota archaeon]|nr:PqqD family peptide modification chaperone [Candidatus Aenigmarchaeota archaeon]